MTAGTRTAPAPAPHRVAIFSVVSLALLMSTLDGTIVATALHSIQHGLGASINWTSWIITAYSVGLVLALSLAGKLSDWVGRRRFFLISVAVFATASLCCGLAGNIFLLIALRVVQAAGGAGFTPSATGIITDNFGDARDKAVGLFGSMFPIGSMIGPIFGGLFVSYWSWRGIFFLNVPIGIILVIFCLRYVPRDSRRESRTRLPMDAGGMVLLGAGALALMVGMSYLGEAGAGATSPLFIVPALASVSCLALFWRHIRRVPDPFIPPRLIVGPGFGAVNVINILYGGAVAGMLALVPLYAVNRYHISVLGSGTLLTAEGIAVVALSALATVVLRRTGYRWPLYAGSVVIAIGTVGLAVRPPGLPPYAWLAIVGCVIGAGTGFSAPASRNAGLQLAPDQSAALAALRSTGRQVGQIGAVSVTTAIIAQSAAPGLLQARVFVAFAVLLVACLPVISRVPEHRGSW
ncbi:MAG: MFS transporter [Nocardiopsaceae bacterium]|nr:MFS transporter [Nocardiopsaceae bacterium]